MKASFRPDITLVFTIFSMFFGSGNAIFPLELGAKLGSETIFGVCGLFVTAILLPFIGLVTMTLYNGNLENFLANLGTKSSSVISAVLLLTLGPLVTLPRCVLVAHASLAPYVSQISLVSFSVGFCLLAYLCLVRPQRINALLGKVLSPILTCCLFSIIGLGLIQSQRLGLTMQHPLQSFHQGFVTGYGTLDLLAALFFAPTVWAVQKEKSAQKLKQTILSSSIFSFLILALIYSGLALTASYQLKDHQGSSVSLLADMSRDILGPTGGLIANIAITLACLTTIIGLTLSIDHFLTTRVKWKIKPAITFAGTLTITAMVAPAGFDQIMLVLIPTLKVIYPVMITFTFLNLVQLKVKRQITKAPTFLVFIISLGCQLILP